MAARPKPRPAQVQPLGIDQPIKPGDLICSNCGTGNDPARRFCRRCGNSLATAIVARKPPWYRRLFGRRRAFAAGERPGSMGAAGQPRRSRVKPVLLVLLLAAVVVLAGGYFVDGRIKGAIDGAIGSVRNVIETTSHPAGQAFDGDVATFWLVDPGGGTPSVTVPLTETVDLIRVLFHSGAGAGPEFSAYGRPRTVEFRFPSLDPIQLELADDPAAQEFDLNVPAVATYEFRIIDFYEADDPGQHLLALRDVILTASIP